MVVTSHKVAYMDSDDAYKLYSEFFDTEAQAKERVVILKSNGYDAMYMSLVSNEEGNYEWGIDKSSASIKYRLGTMITSTKFIVPLVIVIFAYMLIKKNNGLPKIIA